MRTYRRVLLQAACGFGKTVVLTDIVRLALAKGSRVIFAVHRKELIRQTANTFNSFGLDYRIISAGTQSGHAQAYIASIPTLRRWQTGGKPLPPCDLLIIDEAHLSMAHGWQQIIAHYINSGARIIGCSASPRRLDGKGLGNNFETMILSQSVRWLMDNKFLSDYRMFAPSQPDLSGVHMVGGDYNAKELEGVMDKPAITGDAVSHWLRIARGKKTIVYCVSINHSKDTASAFRAAGVNAVHIDGETGDEIRKMALIDFADGRIEVITNCQLFTEGVDISALTGRDVTIECVVNLRPTKSMALWTQICGRALRRKPEPAIILDHANCAREHGLPDDPITWSLADAPSRKKKAAAPPISVRVCSKCWATARATARVCPECGTPFPVKEREIAQVDGDLVEIQREQARKEVRREQGRSQTLDDLVSVYMKRHPDGSHVKAARWASHVLAGREKKVGAANA